VRSVGDLSRPRLFCHWTVWSRTLYTAVSSIINRVARLIHHRPSRFTGRLVRIQWADDSYAGWSYGITVCRAHNNIILWVAMCTASALKTVNENLRFKRISRALHTQMRIFFPPFFFFFFLYLFFNKIFF